MTKRLTRTGLGGDANLKNARLTGAVTPPTYTVATLPPAAGAAGKIINVSNGNAGAACLAVSNGASWLRVSFGAAVAAS